MVIVDTMFARAAHRTWPEQVMVWLTSLGSLVIVGLSVLFLVTLFWPYDPITKLTIRVVGQPRIGETLTVELDYCKTQAWVPDTVRWSLQNSIAIILPTTPMSLPVGCQVKRLSLPLPLHTVPGQYYLQEENIYRPWPWREFTYVRETAPFDLLPPHEDGR